MSKSGYDGMTLQVYLQLAPGLLCATSTQVGTTGKMLPNRKGRLPTQYVYFLGVWERSYETLKHPFTQEISGVQEGPLTCTLT